MGLVRTRVFDLPLERQKESLITSQGHLSSLWRERKP